MATPEIATTMSPGPRGEDSDDGYMYVRVYVYIYIYIYVYIYIYIHMCGASRQEAAAEPRSRRSASFGGRGELPDTRSAENVWGQKKRQTYKRQTHKKIRKLIIQTNKRKKKLKGYK